MLAVSMVYLCLVSEPRNLMEPHAVGGVTDTTPRHTLHQDHEPIDQRPYDLLLPPDGASNKQPKVRKVAAGPPLPTYKGKIVILGMISEGWSSISGVVNAARDQCRIIGQSPLLSQTLHSYPNGYLNVVYPVFKQNSFQNWSFVLEQEPYGTGKM